MVAAPTPPAEACDNHRDRRDSGRRRHHRITPVATLARIPNTNQPARTPFGANRATHTPSVQTVLPFAGLNNPSGVAVDSDGNLYVTDPGNNRVVKLAAG